MLQSQINKITNAYTFSSRVGRTELFQDLLAVTDGLSKKYLDNEGYYDIFDKVMESVEEK